MGIKLKHVRHVLTGIIYRFHESLNSESDIQQSGQVKFQVSNIKILAQSDSPVLLRAELSAKISVSDFFLELNSLVVFAADEITAEMAQYNEGTKKVLRDTLQHESENLLQEVIYSQVTEVLSLTPTKPN